MVDFLKSLWLQLLFEAIPRLVRQTTTERWSGGRATATIRHSRPTRWLDSGRPDPSSYVLLHESLAQNLITDVGRDFLHQQGYASAGLAANGLNYVALSNDALTETTGSTTLSNEITLNGLARTQGTVAHTAGTNTTTVSALFNVTGTQAVQKAALFTAVAGGIMNHVLDFPQRTLTNGDALTVEFTITLG